MGILFLNDVHYLRINNIYIYKNEKRDYNPGYWFP